MTRRTIEISGSDRSLSLSHGQLVVSKDGQRLAQVPADDIALLILDAPCARYTHRTLAAVLENGAAVVFCGEDHLPAGMAVPTVGHHLQAERLRDQIAASKPTLKRLWQQIVRTKIEYQAEACEDETATARLLRLAEKVRSGDPGNVEAQAARVYWGAYLPELKEFRRRREGMFPNPLLNYGYMMLRAAIARALTAAGFHPSLGIRHTNRYNAFCLADDLVEPFRPMVDLASRQLFRNGSKEIEIEEKARLLSLLTHPTGFGGDTGAFINSLEGLCASLHRCYRRDDEDLSIPRPRLDYLLPLESGQDTQEQ